MEAGVRASIGKELYEACVDGSLASVIYLLSRSQENNPSFSAPFYSILYTATSHDHPVIVQYCLENGPSIDSEIMRILLVNRATETYKFLLGRKAVDVNYYIPWFGDILSHCATRDDFEWVRLCLDYGADPNQNLVDEHKSILAAVAELASVKMAALLIKHRARVMGSGAIVMAAQQGKMEMLKMLLNEGADINEIGIEHPTDPRFKADMGSALHRAVEGGHEAIVKFLLESGANARLKDPMGRTPAALATEKGNERIVEMLSERDALEDALEEWEI